jgi:AcrR family transcriptional regulator
MRRLLANIQIKVPENTFLKDPEGSELGKRIIEESIRQIDECGLEAFNFKKLAEAVGSTEASIYRYFENKHKLLLYITSWYWAWLEYQLVFGIANVAAASEKLQRALHILTEPYSGQENYPHMQTDALHRIAISESSKSYFTRTVDDDNRKKLFSPYKALISRMAEIYLEILPNYPHSHSLAVIVVEGILHQSYYAAHLPSLNDIGQRPEDIRTFFQQLSLGTLQQFQNK